MENFVPVESVTMCPERKLSPFQIKQTKDMLPLSSGSKHSWQESACRHLFELLNKNSLVVVMTTFFLGFPGVPVTRLLLGEVTES